MFKAHNERMDQDSRTIRLHTIQETLAGLRSQEEQLKALVEEYLRKFSREQADVERVSGGFWGALYSLSGTKEEKMEKEQAEARKASKQYDEARAALGRVQQQIARLEAEKRALECGRETDYEAPRRRQFSAEIYEMDDHISDLQEEWHAANAQLEEVEEAIRAGKKVLDQANDIEGELGSAQAWGTWDLLGGGVISHIVKHSHLSDAQDGVRHLEELLQDFHSELADISIHGQVHAQVNGFLCLADLIYDGLFVDAAVLSHISGAKKEMRRIREQVEAAMEQLEKMRRELIDHQKSLKKMLKSTRGIY